METAFLAEVWTAIIDALYCCDTTPMCVGLRRLAHLCMSNGAYTCYRGMAQDAKMFRRKKWKYLILDEAHMIKNWRSQRWQTLLNFNSKRRLLITGVLLPHRAALINVISSCVHACCCKAKGSQRDSEIVT